MTTHHATGLAGAVLAAALALTACAARSTTAKPVRPDPVTILRQSGCPVAANLPEQASVDQKSSYASCTWGDPTLFKTTLTVWAYTSTADRDTDLPTIHRQAGRVIILGPNYLAELDADLNGTFNPSPVTVAAAIGGVITPNPSR